MKEKSAIIPIRSHNNETEVLLIRNIANTKWIIPKGTIEAPLNPSLSASKEAFEEAGVIGQALPYQVGTYFRNQQDVPAYLLKVAFELRKYDENKKRNRQWISPKLLPEFIEDEDLLKTILKAVKIFESRGSYFKYIISGFCNELELKLLELNKKEAILQFKDKGTQKDIHISRVKTWLEFKITSKNHFRTLEEIPNVVLSSYLLDNAAPKLGFWCITTLEKGYTFERKLKIETSLLTVEYFKEILLDLVNYSDELVLKQMTAPKSDLL